MPSGRALRSWLQLGLQLALVLLGAVCLQVVADRTNRRFDLTASRDLTLSPVLRQVLGELAEPLRITLFYDRGNRGRYAALVKRLAAETPHLSATLYDLDRYPERARGLGVSEYGQAVVEYAGRRAVVAALPEEQLTGAILKVVRGRARRLAYSVGHGEREPGGAGESYRRLFATLETENYVLDPVSLEEQSVPTDTDVVVVAGPQRDLSPAAVERLLAFLRRGGGVLLLLDPVPLPNLSAALATLGVTLGDDLIVDRERRVLATDGLAAVVEFFKQGNPITGSASSPIDVGVILPSARTVDVSTEGAGAMAESIARTSETAWAMADPERARRGEEPNPALRDRPGPLSVMTMVELQGGDAQAGRLVVTGDADFASDAYYDMLGNANLVLNAIAWLAREDTLAGEHDQEAPEVQRPLSTLVLTEDRSRALVLSMVIVQPLLVLALGAVVVGWRRWRG